MTQLQQELFTLRAQVAAESGLADAVRAFNNPTTAQVREPIPSLIDVKGLGRPKEVTSKEKDFQQWYNKTEAFSAGVIQESEMMLEWTAEAGHGNHEQLTDLEFLPIATNVDRGARNLQFVLQQIHTQHSWSQRVVRPDDTVAQLPEEPTSSWAKAAESIWSDDMRTNTKLA